MKVVGELSAQSGIYCIRNTVNGKVYIGSAVNLLRRLRAHRLLLAAGRHHSRKMQRAWDKYGSSAFEFEVLEGVAAAADLLRREQHYLELFDSATPRYGYNINPVAGSNLGRKFGPYTAERSAKISAANRGRKASAEARAKMSAAKLGRRLSMEWRQRIADSLRGVARPGRKASQAGKTALSKARRGVPKTAAWRQRMRTTWARLPEIDRRRRVEPMLKARWRGAA